ncbi:hypothetical protein E5Q_02384 [Mixia osmundae IAM 14324]|uniref:Uncharacterized protein n=1 Tax=Mixia osmundae (strain CBS 9802 / IAM 14324 / JCM 22182 / KY 12970) TaxID=764103 RepID=G7DYR7_MIXOS|nr:hypothetical protein E5Q_02384 [Mixia osmundae IAM 14324]
MPAQAYPRRRVSYALPIPASLEGLPTYSLPELSWPRNGDPRPAVYDTELQSFVRLPRPRQALSTASPSKPEFGLGGSLGPRKALTPPSDHPRHCLGVHALALDLSTVLSSSTKSDAAEARPAGLLYSGGRDGLIASWELGLPMCKRKTAYGRSRRRSARDSRDRFREQDEDQRDGDSDDSDAGLLGRSDSRGRGIMRSNYEVPPSLRRGSSVEPDTVESDSLRASSQNGIPDALPFEQSWLISASSDRTIQAWSPHDPESAMQPAIVGTHSDYVRCLAHARIPGFVASAGFDRKVKLWDIQEGRKDSLGKPFDLLMSAYALAVDPTGSVLATGSPVKVIQIWDPRAGSQIARLVGHSDNVRALLISDDAKLVLSGSSDGTIKLWSLAMQRPIYTFNHHGSSVWSLASQHPSLSVFYSGDKSGNICKVDNVGCAEEDGDCVLIGRDVETRGGREEVAGICRIVVADDSYVWTSSTHVRPSIKRWRDGETSSLDQDRSARGQNASTALSTDETPILADPAFPIPVRRNRPLSLSSMHERPSVSFAPNAPRPRSVRTIEDRADAPYASRIPLKAPDDAFIGGRAGASTDLLGSSLRAIHSNSSVLSGFGLRASSQQAGYGQFGYPQSPPTLPDHSSNTHEETHDPVFARALQEYLMRESADQATPLRAQPDDVIAGKEGLIQIQLLNDRRHVLTASTVGDILLWDIVELCCVGRISKDQSILDAPLKEAIELVRSRIEGDGTITNWCTVEVNTGTVHVHLDESRCFEAEVYADEMGLEEFARDKEDHRFNYGRLVLRNLFIAFVEHEIRLRSVQAAPITQTPATPRLHRGSVPMFLSLDSAKQVDRSEPLCVRRLMQDGGTALQTPDAGAALATPAPTPALPPAGVASMSRSGSNDPYGQRRRSAMAEAPRDRQMSTGDYFNYTTHKTVPAPVTPSAPPNPVTPSEALSSPKPDASPSTFRGRLKVFGKSKKSVDISEATTPTPNDNGQARALEKPSEPAWAAQMIPTDRHQVEFLSTLFKEAFNPCPEVDAPLLAVPADVQILIFEETSDMETWRLTFRRPQGKLSTETELLEMLLPPWTLDYLLANRHVVKEPVKIPFVLMPYRDDETESLPELPNGNARLSASRVLRVRKILNYISERLESPGTSGTTPGSIASGSLGSTQSSRVDLTKTSRTSSEASRTQSGAEGNDGVQSQPHNGLEVLCSGKVVPYTATLGAVRAFFQKQPGDVVLYYRRQQIA